MPLVRIDVLRGRPEAELTRIASCVHAALIAELEVPERDCFQILTEHEPGRLRFDRTYLDIERTDAWILVHVTLSGGRTTQAKQAFYRSVCGQLHEQIELRPDDLAVVLVENEREDWSFGNGEASYLTLPRQQWR